MTAIKVGFRAGQRVAHRYGPRTALAKSNGTAEQLARLSLSVGLACVFPWRFIFHFACFSDDIISATYRVSVCVYVWVCVQLCATQFCVCNGCNFFGNGNNLLQQLANQLSLIYLWLTLVLVVTVVVVVVATGTAACLYDIFQHIRNSKRLLPSLDNLLAKNLATHINN